MKKHKMIISLVGLAAVVATTATVAAYTLAGDGSSPPANESVGTTEPGFQNDNLPLLHGDPEPNTIDDGKGGVSVTNPKNDGATGGTVPAGQGAVVNADDTPAGKVLPDPVQRIDRHTRSQRPDGHRRTGGPPTGGKSGAHRQV